MVLMVRFLVLSWCMQSNVLETHCNKIRYTWNLIFLPHSHVLTPNVFPPLSNPSTLPTPGRFSSRVSGSALFGRFCKLLSCTFWSEPHTYFLSRMTRKWWLNFFFRNCWGFFFLQWRQIILSLKFVWPSAIFPILCPHLYLSHQSHYTLPTVFRIRVFSPIKIRTLKTRIRNLPNCPLTNYVMGSKWCFLFGFGETWQKGQCWEC